MGTYTEIEQELAARSLRRDEEARQVLTRTRASVLSQVCLSLLGGAAIYVSSGWRELPTSAAITLFLLAMASPYLIFEVIQLRRQMNALIHLSSSGRDDG